MLEPNLQDNAPGYAVWVWSMELARRGGGQASSLPPCVWHAWHLATSAAAGSLKRKHCRAEPSPSCINRVGMLRNVRSVSARFAPH